MKKIFTWKNISISILIFGIFFFFFFQKKVIVLEKEATETLQTKEIQHIVPLNEILEGGPTKDGIPPIDDPVFISITQEENIDETEEGIAFVDGKDVSYFLPFRILVWHEIVNMNIYHKQRDNFPISVTYCPLCKTGVVYEARVGDADVTFGTSGKLWQSNLLMYDRQENIHDENLWSQVLGQSVVGNRAGEKLTIYPSAITSFGAWKKQHPGSLVLSEKTGYNRNYGVDPYGEVYYTGEDIYFPVSYSYEREKPKTVVLGIEINGEFVAYKKEGWEEKNDVFNGSIIAMKKQQDGSIILRVNKKDHGYIEGFWFSWKSVHPTSEIR